MTINISSVPPPTRRLPGGALPHSERRFKTKQDSAISTRVGREGEHGAHLASAQSTSKSDQYGPASDIHMDKSEETIVYNL